jgi:hypothetical protein
MSNYYAGTINSKQGPVSSHKVKSVGSIIRVFPDTGPYPGPDESRLHLHILFQYDMCPMCFIL